MNPVWLALLMSGLREQLGPIQPTMDDARHFLKLMLTLSYWGLPDHT